MTFDLLLTPDPCFGLVFCHVSCGVVTVTKAAVMLSVVGGRMGPTAVIQTLGKIINISEYGIAFWIEGRNSYANIIRSMYVHVNVKKVVF